ncbi:MAG: cell division protein FtsZ [Ignavibacteria bacterium]|nr:cell division protein FtsZ [Ignavibacteria bacterium]MBK7411863.1 cell division protein FtsZ [Ignavibacteria bacterium]
MAIELDTSSFTSDARIRVVGVGGGGGNAVRTMIARGLDGVEFVAANTDRQALMNNPAGIKLQLGKDATRGLGAGADPSKGRASVEESIDDVYDALQGSDMIFVTAGMGGGTGTGAAPVIARVGRELGALVVGIVTKPFAYESKRRMSIAENGIKDLREHVDALIVIPNQRILTVVDKDVTFANALAMVDTVLYNATKGIADIISGVGYVNVDFADVRTVMSGMGDALMGIGMATGEHRAIEAAQNALNSPILEGMSIYGAQGLLVNITGSSNMTMFEVSEAVSAIEKAAGDEVNLIHGVVVDESMEDEISITVVATGFRRQDEKKSVPTTSSASTNSYAPVIEIVRPAPEPEAAPDAYRPAATTQPSPIAPSTTQDVDMNDVNVPAYIRKQREMEQRNMAGMPREEPPSTGSVPIVPPSSNEAVGGYPSPIRKAAGGGGNQPAFLRKIMD